MRAITSVFACFLICVPLVVSAVELAPGASDVIVIPGSSERVTLSVTNDTSTMQTYSADMIAANFGKSETETQLGVLPEEIASWFSVSPSSFQLSPGEVEHVAVTVSPPVTTEPQVVTTALRIVTLAQGEGVRVSSGVIGYVFVSVGSNLAQHGTIVDVDVRPMFSTHQPIDVSVTAYNDGESMLVPYGEVRVKNVFGEVVTMQINPEGKRLPPGQARTFLASWDSSFAVGVFTIETIASAGGDIPAQSLSQTVVIIPWWAIGALLIVAIATVLVVRFRRR